MFIPSLPHMHFFHFTDTCYLGSNDSTKLLEPLLSLIPFWRAAVALVLECYVGNLVTMWVQFVVMTTIWKFS
jgi:hypothetical protein